MPKQIIDYSKSVIYKLVCRDLEVKDFYLGSTTNFASRKKNHRNHSTKPIDRSYNYPVYVFMRAHGGWGNWDMVLVESYPCSTKLELHARERHWVETLKPSLNTTIPAHPYDRSLHRDELATYNRQYRNDHIEAIKERVSRVFECECGKSMIMSSKLKHLQSQKHAAWVARSMVPE